ncbi:MAG TPA: family 78 glycoside hydrolase catalytic domain [Streptosporangiales bacterium]
MSISSPQWPVTEPPVWRAHWIAPAGVATVRNAAFEARTTFALGRPADRAVLHVAAESRYRLSVNGVALGVGPIRGTATVNFFDSYDVAGLLRPGDNVVTVRVQSPNFPTFKAAPVQPCVLVQLDDGGLLATGEHWECRPLPGWRCDVDEFTFQVGDMEWHDLGADGCGWTPASVVTVRGKRLLPRDIPALDEQRRRPTAVPVAFSVPPGVAAHGIADRMNTEPHHPLEPLPWGRLCQESGEPVVVRPRGDGGGVGLVVDFGREVNGAVEIEVTSSGRAVLDIGYEERLTDERRLATVALDYRFADRYVLRPGRQCVTNLFGERGFRMVQLVFRDLDAEARIEAVRGVDRRYPFAERARFTCSDPLLDRIWAMSVETLRACATDTFVDCPWRENAFYVNDMLVENAGVLQAFGDPRLSARCLRLAVSQARQDGLVPGPVPPGLVPGMTEAESADRLVLLAANLLLPLVVEDYLAYSGDARLVAELVDPIAAVFRTFAEWADADGPIHPPARHWNFVDWSYELAGRCLDGYKTAALDWCWVLGLQSAARLARHVGRDDEARRWSDAAVRRAAVTDRVFWDAERRRYSDRADRGPDASSLVQALALLACGTGARRADLVAALEHGDLLEPELYMQSFVLRALAANGRPGAALDRVRRWWGPVAASGSPTVWEFAVVQHGKAAMDDRGSLCHGFSTAPVGFLQGTVLGIVPLTPGFARFRVDPRLAGLRSAAGSVPTPLGDVGVDWYAGPSGVHGRVDVPAGLEGELPDGRVLGPGRHDVEVHGGA